jgi:DGQHR domain-containing protein
MLAMRMRQKEAEFYFVSYLAEDLLRKVRFVSRYYGPRGEAIGGERRRDPDDVEKFVMAIEGSTQAFQRELNRRKLSQIRDFFRSEAEQPIVPGAVLLFTSESLSFQPLGKYDRVGDLVEPQGSFLIIDGQHRLAGLQFYLKEPDADRRLEVPCVIFDGKTSEFATQMFVIINSTHTRINKSHLVDLYEKIEWGTDLGKKYAAQMVRALYEQEDSPLKYHINMLGGRSQQDLWINQAQIFGEIHRLILRKEVLSFFKDKRGWSRERGYNFLRDVFRAARSAFREGWGDNKRYMVTRDVTIKALLRVAGDVALAWGDKGDKGIEPGGDGAKVLEQRFVPWSELVREFRREGFYERFPARGQVERVEKIRRRLDREAGIVT